MRARETGPFVLGHDSTKGRVPFLFHAGGEQVPCLLEHR
jgi:hypothetical protein